MKKGYCQHFTVIILLVWNIPDLHVLVHCALYVPLEDEPSILALLFTITHKLIPCPFSYLSEMYWLVMKNACFVSRKEQLKFFQERSSSDNSESKICLKTAIGFFGF